MSVDTVETPAAGSTAAAPAPSRPRRRGRRATPYLLVLPAVVLELLVHIVPMLVGIWMSFVRLTQFFIANWSQAPSAGLDNYKIALDFSGPLGKSLLHSFGVTLAYTVLVVGVAWLFGMSGALVLHRSFRGRGFLRTLFLVPYAMPIYAGIMTWSFIFQRDNGLMNHLVKSLGLGDGESFWLVGNNAFASMAIVAIWRAWPFAFLMLLAGLQNVPDEVYDAASVDGAGIWKQVRYITLPYLRPVNVVLVLMLFLWTFNDFNTPFVLFGPTPPRSADLMSIHIYGNSFVSWNFGFGAAMSVLLLLFLLVVTGLYLFLTSRRSRRA
ncbi:sugar ABC transporter permease [Luteipulveratus sp. YIM 133132]|uniref:carbohydrate ABC transporter permease n=1 Tax=Luteipulveratus flavus TaxID=3031728 RepID=UPI0023B0EAF5|nr:sugar ABC transporter permease [Luteipulveratus sp. YIM 133132]MDE9364193.1 sugar ABC transporter permease [Luteipulveratus sp. YIM 133132]